MPNDALPGGDEAGKHCRDAGLPVRDGRHFLRFLTVPRPLHTTSSMA